MADPLAIWIWTSLDEGQGFCFFILKLNGIRISTNHGATQALDHCLYYSSFTEMFAKALLGLAADR